MGYLNCVQIETAIKRARKLLIEEYKEVGKYKEFGKKEIASIEEKFIDYNEHGNFMNKNIRKLREFKRWCEDFSENSY